METIIIQDTDQDILDILYTALELEGFRVYGLNSCGEDFIELIGMARPHVVMMDYRLSGENCIRACREIKARYPHLPVLALSCNSNINEVYSRSGFDGYIEKPFELDQLYGILRKYIPQQDNTL
ncbi:response regulator [Mucilaginibacter sp.]|jgi:DNA-binding NtrC family response regulator|uniref:response regulator n=1 Tax=Mucilaginibacter sp. TaxID=1882438 RepID=UPI0035648D50